MHTERGASRESPSTWASQGGTAMRLAKASWRSDGRCASADESWKRGGRRERQQRESGQSEAAGDSARNVPSLRAAASLGVPSRLLGLSGGSLCANVGRRTRSCRSAQTGRRMIHCGPPLRPSRSRASRLHGFGYIARLPGRHGLSIGSTSGSPATVATAWLSSGCGRSPGQGSALCHSCASRAVGRRSRTSVSAELRRSRLRVRRGARPASLSRVCAAPSSRCRLAFSQGRRTSRRSQDRAI